MKKKIVTSILALTCVASIAALASPAFARDDEVLSPIVSDDFISDEEYETYTDGELSSSIDISNRFNLNSNQVYVDDMNVVELPALEKDGKKVIYWCSTEDGTGNKYYPGDEYIIGTESELFAIWDDYVAPLDKNYIFDVSDFEDFVAEAFAVEEETDIKELVPEFDGYEFVEATIDGEIVLKLDTTTYLVEIDGKSEWKDITELTTITLKYSAIEEEVEEPSNEDENEDEIVDSDNEDTNNEDSSSEDETNTDNSDENANEGDTSSDSDTNVDDSANKPADDTKAE